MIENPPQEKKKVRLVEVDDDSGQRIDNFLLRECRGVPRSRVYRMIRRGEVRVNGSRARPMQKLLKGDRVRIPPVYTRPRMGVKPPDSLIKQMQEAICDREDGFLLLNKPAGIAVHGGTGVRFGLIDILNARNDAAGKEFILVHRLDRDTSGCLLVATNPQMARRIGGWFRTREVEKRYDALVCGQWPDQVRRVSLALRRAVAKNGESRVYVDEFGEPAITLAEPVQSTELISWIEFRPETGRTHQIRVHAKATGHPIVGDDKYGIRNLLPHPPRMMLHASAIELPDGRKFSVPVDASFSDYWDAVNSSCSERSD